jgi:hypothetical protein
VSDPFFLRFCGSTFGMYETNKSSTFCIWGRLDPEKKRLSEERDNPSEIPLSESDCVGLPLKLRTCNIFYIKHKQK